MTILNAIATDRFTSPCACIKHSYYAQFVKFLFLTGVRPQLAIALEWEQIIWEQDRPIKIYFDRAYTCGILKPSKGDRNGKNTPRVFPVNSELADLIMAIPQRETIHREPRISRHLKTVNRPHYPNLVFPSPRRWYITIDSFTNRIFKPVVKALVDAGEISEYLPTYHARHTTQNRWLDSGMSEETITALLDTSPKMIRKHYRDDRRYYENLAQNVTLPELGD
jgi:integrase